MLTHDGVPIVIHDFTLDKTTNGSGLVKEHDLHAIKVLDAGSHYDFQFRDERVPTLDEAFEALGRELIINVELKTLSWRSDGLELAVLKRDPPSQTPPIA